MEKYIMTGRGERPRRYRRKRYNPFLDRGENYRIPMKKMRSHARYGRHGRWSYKPYFPFSGDREMAADHRRYGLR